MVVDGVASLTYGEWDRRSDALARGLVRRGGRPGDRALVLFDNTRLIELACAYAAVHKASMVPVLLPPPLLGGEVARVVEDCGASAVLCPPELMPSGSLSALAATPAQHESEHGDDPLSSPPARNGVAEVLYQSSPLGRPRATARSHHDLEPPPWPALPLLHTFEAGTPAAQHALRLPLHHKGATVVVLPRFDLDRFWSVASGGRVGAVGISPAMARVIAGSGPVGEDLSSVRHVLLSAPVPGTTAAALATAFPSAAVVQAWTPEPATPMAGGEPVSRPPWAFSQEGLLWYEQLAPACMNLPPVVRRLVGPLHVPSLEAALDELVRRHEPLRTTFEVVGGNGVQVIGEPRPVQLSVIDLSATPPPDRDDEVARVVGEATSTPFDLVAGRIFQPRLLRLAPDEHLLVVAVNHAFWDDWSESVFKREMSQLYEAFLAGQEPQLPEPPVTFGDFARKQRQSLSGTAGDAHLSYWRHALAGAPLVVQLPVGDPALPEGSAQPPAAPSSLQLGTQLSQELRSLARDLHATPFMTMLAAFAVLVERYTGQDDVLLASVVANRDRAELHGLIGGFAKKIVLRVRLGDDPTFPELVARARESVLAAVAHQDLPYETILQEGLGPAAAAHGVVPYLGVMFQGLAPPRARLSLPGVEASRFHAQRAGGNSTRAHFSSATGERAEADRWGSGLYTGTFLRLVVMETRDGLACEAWGAVHPPAVGQLLDDYQALLTDIAAHPRRRVSQLDVAVGDRGTATARIEPGGGYIGLRGLRIDTRRLEAALAACPGIDAAAVTLAADGAGGEQLMAYVVSSAPAPPEPAEVRARLWSQLPGYAWPAAMMAVESIPRLPDGRPDLDRLPAPPLDLRTSATRSGFVAPRTPEEHLLAACWAEVLGVGEVSATESYWQSFSFLDAVALARRAGLTVTLSDVANNRTVETLAAAVSARRA